MARSSENEPTVIRIGQRGWDHDEGAASVAETGAGIGVAWVEVAGIRIPGDVISGVDWRADGSRFSAPSVELIGRVEIIYVDEHGDPLPAKRRRRARAK